MKMKWACYDDAVEIFHVQQSLMISKGLNTGNQVLGLIASSRVDIGNRDQLRIWNVQQLFEQV